MKESAFIVFIIVFLFAGLLGLVHWFVDSNCDGYGDVTGLNTQTLWFGVCMIEDPELGWVTYEERKMSRVTERTR